MSDDALKQVTPIFLPSVRVHCIPLSLHNVHLQFLLEATLPSWFPKPSSGNVIPAVVLHHHDRALSLDTVRDSFDRFLQTDDVFQSSFTKDSFLLVGPPSSSPPVRVPQEDAEEQYLGGYASGTGGQTFDERVPSDLADYLKSQSLVLCFVDQLSVPEGPYFVTGRQLHQAWRLYPDHLAAFTTTVVPNDTISADTGEGGSRFQSFQSSAFTGSDAAVAVPSRLYFKETLQKPLSGRRIAIKDNIDLGGVVTGIGNKAYAELYGERSESAKFVQLLVDRGAIIVGKTKLSAFAGSEVPPCQCIDYFPPWNARGDGYQGPSGSSSGAGSSAAGYEWLDLSIGTDTTGSIRFPATSHGVWGLRSSWNSLPTEGLVPACSTFDTFGLLGRTSSAIGDILSASGLCLESNNWPTRLLYPTEWLPVAHEAQQRMTDAFVAALETHLGLKHEKMSLQEEWARTRPEALSNKTLFDIVKSAEDLNFYDNEHNFDGFRAEYREKFDRSAYISPSHLSRWEVNINKTREQRDQALKEVEIFRDWARKTFLSVREDGTSSTIMIVPHGRPGANYRDVAAPAASAPGKAPPALNAVYLVSAMGTPQLLIPIGQNPYQSRISGREEYAPIFTTLVGAPRSDLTLLRVGQETLESAGWPTTVLTGRYMFKVGDNERHSASSHSGSKL